MTRKIFEPLTMNHMTLRNRLIRSATWEGIAGSDGSIPEEGYEIYRELSHGGIGAVIVSFTDVSQDDYDIHGMMRLSRDELIPHYNMSVIDMFIQAAVRAKKAGFDGVQIHAAHFFFLSRFISPRVNHRTDMYGGNTINRSRILIDILNGIKRQCKDIHVMVKINCNDFMSGGLNEEESLEICRLLADNSIDSNEYKKKQAALYELPAFMIVLTRSTLIMPCRIIPRLPYLASALSSQ